MPQRRSANGRFAANGHSLYGGPYGNGLDLIALNMLQQGIQNASVSLRSTLAQRIRPDDRRSIEDECGYPDTRELDAQSYRDMFDRNPIAARVVEVLPAETWQSQPTIFEDEDTDTVTPFEEAWDNLGRSLQDTDSLTPESEPETWYQDEEGNPIWEWLIRADILSGIGAYGALFMGFDDGENLAQPVKPREGRRLLFMRVVDESLIRVTRWVNDRKNPRHSKPEQYAINFSDPSISGVSLTGIGLDMATHFVHWTRVIHIADNMMSSEILGVPRMQPVYNRLYDLEKLYGGSGEMYWRGAFPGYSFETHPQLGGEVFIDHTRIKDQMEQWINGLQRMMTLSGMTMKDHAPQVVDPTPQINNYLDAICIRLAMPKRIFVGSERGELASSQDAKAWHDRIRGRQRNYVTPRIIVPFVNRLIRVGVLPKPTGYSVKWPDPDTLSPVEKADVLLKRTQSMAAYVQGGADTLIEPMDYLSREMEYTEEEATAILEKAIEHVEEQEEKSLEAADEAAQRMADGIPGGIPGGGGNFGQGGFPPKAQAPQGRAGKQPPPKT